MLLLNRIMIASLSKSLGVPQLVTIAAAHLSAPAMVMLVLLAAKPVSKLSDAAHAMVTFIHSFRPSHTAFKLQLLPLKALFAQQGPTEYVPADLKLHFQLSTLSHPLSPPHPRKSHPITFLVSGNRVWVP